MTLPEDPAVCEWCWVRAFGRAMGDTSKSQAEHYADLLVEQDAEGANAQCPTVRFHGGREHDAL